MEKLNHYTCYLTNLYKLSSGGGNSELHKIVENKKIRNKEIREHKRAMLLGNSIRKNLVIWRKVNLAELESIQWKKSQDTRQGKQSPQNVFLPSKKNVKLGNMLVPKQSSRQTYNYFKREISPTTPSPFISQKLPFILKAIKDYFKEIKEDL